MALAQRLQLAVGRAQYRAITAVVVRALGLRARMFEVRGVRMPALVRDGVGAGGRGGTGSGDGRPLVLVHGFGTDKEGWLITAARLARGRGLVIPDLPGFGDAGAIGPARATAAAQAAALVGLLDALGLGRVHLAGSSMGGGVVMRVAADFPQRVASLTLIGSVGPIVEPSEVVTAIGRGENPLVLSGPDDWDRFMALVAERPPKMTRAMARFMAHEKALRRDAHEELLRAWIGAGDDGPPALLESIETPALIVHGAKDRVIHVSTAHALAERLPRARLEVLERVGHAPQAEAPRRLARLIEAHLAMH